MRHLTAQRAGIGDRIGRLLDPISNTDSGCPLVVPQIAQEPKAQGNGPTLGVKTVSDGSVKTVKQDSYAAMAKVLGIPFGIVLWLILNTFLPLLRKGKLQCSS